MNRKLALVFWLVALLSIACRTDSTASKPDAGGQKLGGVYPQKVGDFWVNETAVTPFAIKDTGGVTRDTFETAHGVAVFGGGGSDYYAAAGPLTGLETAASAVWLLPNGIARSGNNFAMYGDGTSVLWNTRGASGTHYFYAANATEYARINSTLLQLTTVPTIQYAAAVTTPAINQAQASSGSGQNLAITAQAAQNSSGNNGGQLQLSGGAGGGSLGTSEDGAVVVGTPFSGGLLSITPVNGANNLSVAQSDKNFVLLNAGATGVFTITYARKIATTTCVWIKNLTSQTATIAYESGGTVTLATVTSALVCSDGSNLQKIMTGT